MRKLRQGTLLLFSSLLVAGMLTGCTYESGEKTFLPPQEPQKDIPQTESATQWLTAAIEKGKTDPDAQKFWYKGYVKNMILSRTTTSMFDGAVIKPDGYNVDVRIARQPYQFYQINDKRFIRINDAWITAKDEPLLFDVLTGFDDLLPLMSKAVQLPDDPVYSEDCVRFQVKTNAQDWLANSQSQLFEPLKKQLAGRTDVTQILNDSTVKMTIWIGRKDHLIHQYETWIILPMPGAGYMDQQVQFSFFKYNDPGLKIKPPADVEKYLLH